VTTVEQPTADWTTEPGVQEALREADARKTFDPEALAGAVHALTAAVAAVNAAAVGSDALPWTDLAAMLNELREARKDLHAVEGNLEVRAARAMAAADTKAAPVEGVGFVEWRRGRDRREWQHDALAKDVLAAHMAEVGGEVVDPFTVRDWLLGAAHVDYWRSTVLARLGLSVEDYSVSLPGRLTVQITHSD
jgi:hypothetical protein